MPDIGATEKKIIIEQKGVFEKPKLGERITRYLTEPSPPQAGFLPRREWEKELKKSLREGENMVVFADIAGAGEQEPQEIVTTIAEFIADISYWAYGTRG